MPAQLRIVPDRAVLKSLAATAVAAGLVSAMTLILATVHIRSPQQSVLGQAMVACLLATVISFASYYAIFRTFHMVPMSQVPM